jgi:uncharacterized protein
MSISFSITLAAIALLALLLIALSLNISRLRMRYQATYGDAGKKDLMMAIRAHGNSLEQSLLFIPLLAAAQIGLVFGATTLAAMAGVFIFSRVLYSVAVFTRQLALRQAAHVLSVGVQLALSVGILIRIAS